MSKADEFRQYAEQAMRWARQSKTEKEKLLLIELARTWMQAALQRESLLMNGGPIDQDGGRIEGVGNDTSRDAAAEAGANPWPGSEREPAPRNSKSGHSIR